MQLTETAAYSGLASWTPVEGPGIDGQGEIQSHCVVLKYKSPPNRRHSVVFFLKYYQTKLSSSTTRKAALYPPAPPSPPRHYNGVRHAP